MTGSSRETIQAAGAVVFRVEHGELEFLLVRNSRHHTWAPPKGHLETGESHDQAARRELNEELGEQPGLHYIAGFMEVVAYQVRKGGLSHEKEVTWFLARHGGDPLVRSAEHDAMAWVSMTEALRLLDHEGLQGLLQKACAFVRDGKGRGEVPCK